MAYWIFSKNIQDLIDKGIHSSFKIDNSYQTRHFKNSEYQIIISQKNNKIQLEFGIQMINYQTLQLKYSKM